MTKQAKNADIGGAMENNADTHVASPLQQIIMMSKLHKIKQKKSRRHPPTNMHWLRRSGYWQYKYWPNHVLNKIFVDAGWGIPNRFSRTVPMVMATSCRQ
jgi:hypothetical protein